MGHIISSCSLKQNLAQHQIVLNYIALIILLDPRLFESLSALHIFMTTLLKTEIGF